MATSYVRRVSRNGKVLLPPEAMARWSPTRVVVVDLGDRLVLRPLPDDAVADAASERRRR